MKKTKSYLKISPTNFLLGMDAGDTVILPREINRCSVKSLASQLKSIGLGEWTFALTPAKELIVTRIQ